MGDLTSLIDQAIPSGRQGLQECSSNLERVAAYCEANYLQVANKAAALDETKRYAVQSLASVAYQINTLANNLLQALDFECGKIAQVEAFVNAQEISIHKEKVARREIGVLTTNRSIPRYHQIVAPAQQEKGQRYVRLPVDYTMLDDIGIRVSFLILLSLFFKKLKLQAIMSNACHGLKTNAQTNSSLSVGRTSGSSTNSANSNYLSFPISNYSASPVSKVGSVSCRIPKRISGNGLPSSVRLRRGGAIRPHFGISQSALSYINIYGATITCFVWLVNHTLYRTNMQIFVVFKDILPPMPPDSMLYASQFGVNAQPSVPSDEYVTGDESVTLRRSYSVSESTLDEWIPKSYIEKVTAIYDYTAEKPDELSFQENAIIYVLRKNDDGWYEGVMDGVTGLFPGNYVEPCS
ncbi:abl interactor 1 [Trichuris trichiura]|uniref:Abl interactor 1 n=1 Tax=Trichuris trichiura TaxID=36087 RepID=A0A077ZC48_TRITR|nr:abl interactor 1 [Trichuris trichiura]